MSGRAFNSEDEFLRIVEDHDRLIRDCAYGRITFDEFLTKYDNFYHSYALDGHESDEQELDLFEKYNDRIAPHKELVDRLSNVCSDDDAAKQTYIDAGRFGNVEAVKRLKEINSKYFDGPHN